MFLIGIALSVLISLIMRKQIFVNEKEVKQKYSPLVCRFERNMGGAEFCNYCGFLLHLIANIWFYCHHFALEALLRRRRFPYL